MTHEALLALPTSTGLTFAGGGTLRAACGRSARCCWRLLLLLLRRLLRRSRRLLLLRLLRRRLAPLLLPLLLLPLNVKAAGAAVGTAALALAFAPTSRRGIGSSGSNVLLQQILLLGDEHGCLGLGLGHEAVLDLARMHGQAGDLLVELTARSCNVLAKYSPV